MQTIILKPLHHRDKECIGIYFEKNAEIQSLILKKVGARWSKTNSCWYVTCTGENYIRLKSALENKAELEIEALRKFLLEKRKGDVVIPAINHDNKRPNTPTGKHSMASSKNSGSPVSHRVANLPKVSNPDQTLSKENQEALQQFKRQLVLKAYSQSTIRTYDNEFRQFLHTIKDKPASGFSVSRLKDYFHYCYTKLHLSENTLHSKINAFYPVGLKK